MTRTDRDTERAPRPNVDFGSGRIVLGSSRAQLVVAVRPAVVTAAGVLVVLVLGVVALTLGEYPLSVGQVVGSFTGATDGLPRTVALEWRLPRAIAAIAFGAALAVSGAVFQTLTRNPLASPDIIGLANGAFTGMLVALLVIEGSWVTLLTGSFAGGLGAAAVIYLLALRGGLQGFRFIVVGIGVSAMLAAINSWMLLRIDVDTALFASAWGAGTLNTATATTVVPATLAIVLLLAVLPLAAPALRQLDLGDDVAAASGVALARSRLALITVAVALVSVVTTVAGPIAFIALSAPQIARRLARTPTIPLAPTAVLGSVLLLGSDLVAQHVIPLTVPVGVVTVVLGGGYLVWLLAHENRKRP